jgi:hypothetical protein
MTMLIAQLINKLQANQFFTKCYKVCQLPKRKRAFWKLFINTLNEDHPEDQIVSTSDIFDVWE